MKYDAIIVGARAAGSPTAMLLAHKGYRVLLVDKAHFPSDTVSTHYIHQPGVARLVSWGLLGKVADSNCPPISKATLDIDSTVIKGSSTTEEFGEDAYSPRRRVLDKILADGALEAGAELREGFSVDQILMDGERVIGIRGFTRNGSVVKEFAPVVIGADGVRSLVARTVRARTYDAKRSFSCSYYSYWSGIAMEGAEVYVRPRRIVAAWPTNDDLVIVFVELPRDDCEEFRVDIEGNFLKAIQQVPGLAARVSLARREERFYAAADLPNFFRRPFEPGWALVGDAGYHRDPVTAQGITDAFRDAELLSAAINNGYSGTQPLEFALADYERQRNQAVKGMYWLTCRLAAHRIPGGRLLLWALKGDQAETNRFIGTVVGTSSISEFFSPINLLRIIGKRCLRGKSSSRPAHDPSTKPKFTTPVQSRNCLHRT
jgi:2-polyprenyl-6-methoxyphenol hydroxylase-like FAD-dependent oxidoreductase